LGYEVCQLDFAEFVWLLGLRGLLGFVRIIMSDIHVFKFIGFVSVIKAIRAIFTLNEYSKELEARSERQGRWDVCNLSAHFAERDRTYVCCRKRSLGLRRGTRRRQG
jgi:hypothetical protein